MSRPKLSPDQSKVRPPIQLSDGNLVTHRMMANGAQEACINGKPIMTAGAVERILPEIALWNDQGRLATSETFNADRANVIAFCSRLRSFC